jgi:PAS domain S-box-containing protein
MRGRALVVEDNLPLAENVAELLEAEGLEVQVCTSGAEARARAGERGFDVAVVDVGLPDVRGVDLVPDLRAGMPDGEVILMTGGATLDTAIAAVQRGVLAYVQKPFQPEELLALVDRALSQVQLRRERRRLAQELAASERLYRGVVESVDELIVGIDANGAIRVWNRFAAATSGVSHEEALGKEFVARFVIEEEREAVRELLAEARAGKRVHDQEWSLPSRDRAHRVVRWHVTPLLAQEREETLLLLVGTDVTERRELERRAADAEAMASLATLTTGLAHEIRNPLNAALLQLELLSRLVSRIEGPLRDRTGECTRLVQAEIQRLTKLLEDFLQLARPRRLAQAPVDVAVLCEHVVTMHRPVAEAAGITLSLHIASGLPKVLGDQSRLTQVLINLVVNALDAMRGQPRGEITVSVEPWPERKVRIAVSDRGPGISAEVAPQIFTPFFSTKERGTGLGLSIAKRIIDLHGGTVDLRPRPDGGAIAEIVLRAA